MEWYSDDDRGDYFLDIRKRLRKQIKSMPKGNTYIWKVLLQALLRSFYEFIIAHYENCYRIRQQEGGLHHHLWFTSNLVQAMVRAEEDLIPEPRLRGTTVACSLALKACVELWNACVESENEHDPLFLERLNTRLSQLNMDLLVPEMHQNIHWGTSRRYFLAVQGPSDETSKWAPEGDPIDVFLAALQKDIYRDRVMEDILDKKNEAVDSYTTSIANEFFDKSSDKHQKLWEELLEGFDRESRKDHLECVILFVQLTTVKGDQKAQQALVRLTGLAWLEHLSTLGEIKQQANNIVQMIDYPDKEAEKEQPPLIKKVWGGISLLAEITGPVMLDHFAGRGILAELLAKLGK